ncbi:MAG: hypothetical protein LBB08_02895 [Rickettsiales bacterium]|jgi:hypothetical protein|nr:hypothetical protein [Rickettsiales bacterium]
MNIKKCLDCGTYASVGFHFVCCGLPLVLVLAGTGASFLDVPRGIMAAALVLAGLLLAASVVLEIGGLCCGRRSKLKLALLGVCALLYATGLAGHFGLFRSADSAISASEPAAACH